MCSSSYIFSNNAMRNEVKLYLPTAVKSVRCHLFKKENENPWPIKRYQLLPIDYFPLFTLTTTETHDPYYYDN